MWVIEEMVVGAADPDMFKMSSSSAKRLGSGPTSDL